MLCAQQEFIDAIKVSEPEKARLLDSFYQVYQLPKNTRHKLETALALWTYFGRGSNQKIVLKANQNLAKDDIEAWANDLQNLVQTELKREGNQDVLANYFLLRSYWDSKTSCEENLLEQLEPNNLDSLQKALYYFNLQSCRSSKAYNESYYTNLLLKAKRLIPNGTQYYLPLARINIRLGHVYFQQLKLDSAAMCYDENIGLFEELSGKAYYYIPGFGIVNRAHQESRSYMNLGLVNDRRGALKSAAQYYEQSVAISNKRNSKASTYWAQTRLMNALFDVGDRSSACREFKSLAYDAYQKQLNGNKLNYSTILGAIEELDIWQIRDNLALIDSVFTATADIHYGKSHPYPVSSISAAKPHEYRLYSRTLSLRLLIDRLKGEDIHQQDYVTLLQTVAATYFEKYGDEKDETVGEMMSRFLAWEIATSNTPGENSYGQLMTILKPSRGHGNWKQIIQMASWAMKLTNKTQQEIEIIEILLPSIESGGHQIARVKTYRQLAQAYEKAGNFQQAINYLNQYDALRETTQRLDQHEQLAQLDKKLEVSETKRQKAELEIINQELEARKWRLRIGIIAISMVLLLSIFLFNSNRQRITAKRKKVEAENLLLEKDISLKEQEMQRTTMELLRSNQSFSRLLGDMERLTTNLNAENRKKARSLLIDHKAKAQEDIWRQFNLQFQNHHADFYVRLDTQYPDLTETEKRICAMHISHLSSKEIGAITGQTLNSIYALKSKVRKKLNAADDEQLTSVLEGL